MAIGARSWLKKLQANVAWVLEPGKNGPQEDFYTGNGYQARKAERIIFPPAMLSIRWYWREQL
jgi:hypothetical protein